MKEADIVDVTSELELINLADVQPLETEWLWDQRWPTGTFCLLAGDPTAGKSVMTVDMAARISRGHPFPDTPSTPNPAGDVIFLTAEDSIAKTIVRRAMAAGADLQRISVARMVTQTLMGINGDKESGQRFFNLRDDLLNLERAIGRKENCRLVVIDTVDCYMAGADGHKAADVRGILTPLADLAERTNVCILGIMHLRKQESNNPMYRLAGSMAYIGQSRAAWICVPAASGDRRFFLHLKSNLGPMMTGLSYTIEAPDGIARVAWDPTPVTMTARDAMAALTVATKRDDATELLRELLSTGPLAQKAIEQHARDAGISWPTVRRASDELKIHKAKSGMSGGWVWSLPEDAHHHPQKVSTFQDAHLSTFGGAEDDHLNTFEDAQKVPLGLSTFGGEGSMGADEAETEYIRRFDPSAASLELWRADQRKRATVGA